MPPEGEPVYGACLLGRAPGQGGGGGGYDHLASSVLTTQTPGSTGHLSGSRSLLPTFGVSDLKVAGTVLVEAPRPKGSSASAAFSGLSGEGCLKPVTSLAAFETLTSATHRLPPRCSVCIVAELARFSWAGCSLSRGWGFTQRRSLWFFRGGGWDCIRVLAVLFITKLRGHGKRVAFLHVSSAHP